MPEIITTCEVDLVESTLAELRDFVYSTEELPDDMAVRVRVVGEDAPSFVPLRAISVRTIPDGDTDTQGGEDR